MTDETTVKLRAAAAVCSSLGWHDNAATLAALARQHEEQDDDLAVAIRDAWNGPRPAVAWPELTDLGKQRWRAAARTARANVVSAHVHVIGVPEVEAVGRIADWVFGRNCPARLREDIRVIRRWLDKEERWNGS